MPKYQMFQWLGAMFLFGLTAQAYSADEAPPAAGSASTVARQKQKSPTEIMAQVRAAGWSTFREYAEIAASIPPPLDSNLEPCTKSDSESADWFASPSDRDAWMAYSTGMFPAWVGVWGAGYFGLCGRWLDSSVIRQLQAALGTPVTGKLSQDDLRRIIDHVADPRLRQGYLAKIDESLRRRLERRLEQGGPTTKDEVLALSNLAREQEQATKEGAPQIFGIRLNSPLRIPLCSSAIPDETCYLKESRSRIPSKLKPQGLEEASVFFSRLDRPGWMHTPDTDAIWERMVKEDETKQIAAVGDAQLYIYKQRGLRVPTKQLQMSDVHEPIFRPDLVLLLDGEQVVGTVISVDLKDSDLLAATRRALEQKYGPGNKLIASMHRAATVQLNTVTGSGVINPATDYDLEAGTAWETDDVTVSLMSPGFTATPNGGIADYSERDEHLGYAVSLFTKTWLGRHAAAVENSAVADKKKIDSVLQKGRSM